MAYSLYSSAKGPRRYWYSACPKTGTQSLKHIFDQPEFKDILSVTYIPDDYPTDTGDQAGTIKWHQPVQGIVQQDEFSYERDHIFATIRNPWARYASYYRYQKNKCIDKIEAYEAGMSYSEYQTSQIMKDVFGDTTPPVRIEIGSEVVHHSYCSKEDDVDNKFIDRMTAMRDVMLDSFETLIDHVWYCYGKDLYNDSFSIYRMPDSLKMMSMTCTPQSLYYQCVTTGQPVHFLKLEDPDMIINFINKHFNITVEMPSVNVTGHGEDYKSLYNSRTKEIISILEADIIRIGSYKY
jgi:hypothetical protein